MPSYSVSKETRIVVILRDDLAARQRANATAFLVSGIAADEPATVGEPYEDASGNRYLPMFREPAYMYMCGRDDLFRAAAEPASAGYPSPCSPTTSSRPATTTSTGRRSGLSRPTTSPSSASPFGTDRKAADRITKGLRFHP